MPVYSVSRTSQYTTVTALETKTNQDGFSWNGFDLDGYHSFFVVTRTTVCPVANQTWDYSNAAAPTSAYVWYPYSITLTVSGGNPNALGQRPGIAYLKLYNSAGTYLMGSYTTNGLQTSGATAIFLTTGPSVQATTFTIVNSRNTLTLTTASTTFGTGFAAPTTGTAFWNIFARTTGQTGQNVFRSSFTSTVNAGTGNISGASISRATNSLMGFITYNACPPQPTTLVITTTATGISITCQSNEAQSLVSATVGGVVYVRFFYSKTIGGTYNYLGADTAITRTLISGTTYQYTATFSGGVTLTQGERYYFKVATMNDLCIAYQAENAGSIPASEQSTAVLAQYGRANIVSVRNPTNTAWTKIDVKVRNAANSAWTNAEVAVRDATNTDWAYN
jgi:hypothetical protein